MPFSLRHERGARVKTRSQSWDVPKDRWGYTRKLRRTKCPWIVGMYRLPGFYARVGDSCPRDSSKSNKHRKVQSIQTKDSKVLFQPTASGTASTLASNVKLRKEPFPFIFGFPRLVTLAIQIQKTESGTHMNNVTFTCFISRCPSCL